MRRGFKMVAVITRAVLRRPAMHDAREQHWAEPVSRRVAARLLGRLLPLAAALDFHLRHVHVHVAEEATVAMLAALRRREHLARRNRVRVVVLVGAAVPEGAALRGPEILARQRAGDQLPAALLALAGALRLR